MASPQAIRALVLDMQPIDPPIGGGRLRVLGIYHALGLPTTYIGTYDWPGPKRRRLRLSDTLEEFDVPLSEEHFRVSEQWKDFNSSRTVIDTAFPLMARLSTEFLRTVTQAVRTADIVVFSHPWVYPTVRDVVDDVHQLLVYDAQNFEGLLRAEILDDGAFGSEIVKHVVATELELARRVDLLLTCAQEDARLFQEVYGVEARRLRSAPNGVFCDSVCPATRDERADAKRALGISGPCAIFLGSAFGPNIDAVRFICTSLSPALPGVTFLVCGGVSDAAEVAVLRNGRSSNVHFSGQLTDEQKLQYLRAADLAVNPMFAGSGSNLKMFEFAAAGLPIVTTAVGARGTESDGETLGLTVEPTEIASVITTLLSDLEKAHALGRRARRCAELNYAWERISPRVGRMLTDSLIEKRNGGRTAGPRAQHAAPPSPQSCPTSHTSTEWVGEPTSVALLTTWGIRCGIAEHSQQLCAELGNLGIECHILANVLSPDEALLDGDARSPAVSMERVWHYHQRPAASILGQCRRRGVERLWIQYHTAFFHPDVLCDTILRANRAGLATTVTLHDTRRMSVESLAALAAVGGTFVVHEEGERSKLLDLGFRDIHQLPLGVTYLPTDGENERSRDTQRAPVLGTFGFLRPHKGLRELIEATAILSPLFPSISLLALQAIYPTPESQSYLADCENLIRALGLGTRVRIETDFLPIEDVIRSLRACDVIVLPYHRTEEGASAAAQVAVATLRPLITTRQSMFRSLGKAAYAAESEAPSVLAAAIATVLSSPLLRAALRSGADAHVAASSISSIARRYAALLRRGQEQ